MTVMIPSSYLTPPKGKGDLNQEFTKNSTCQKVVLVMYSLRLTILKASLVLIKFQKILRKKNRKFYKIDRQLLSRVEYKNFITKRKQKMMTSYHHQHVSKDSKRKKRRKFVSNFFSSYFYRILFPSNNTILLQQYYYQYQVTNTIYSLSLAILKASLVLMISTYTWRLLRSLTLCCSIAYLKAPLIEAYSTSKIEPETQIQNHQQIFNSI